MKLLNVNIERGAGLTIPALVYDFEYPVLEAIHGDENLSVTADADADEDITADKAFVMLTARYDAEIVKSVYKTARDLARVTGLSGGAGTHEKDVQASVKVREPVKPAKKAASKT